MKYEEAEKRLKKIAADSRACIPVYIGSRDAEAIETILADVETWRATCGDAASTLIVVSAQREAFRDVLKKIKKLATSGDVPIAVLTEIINLVTRLNLSDAAEPQKDPS